MADKALTKVAGGAKRKYSSDEEMIKAMSGRVQPQAVDVEQAVLGAILIDKDAFSVVSDILIKEAFYTDAHFFLFETMTILYAESQPIDLLTVHEALKKSGNIEKVGGIGYLVELSNKVGSAANIEFHARIILQKFIQRELIRVSTDVIKKSYDDTMDVLDILDQAEQSIFEISNNNLSSAVKSIQELAVQAKKDIEAIAAKGEATTGVTTGFKELNNMTNGWQKSDLIIIAARPGMGKTAFTLSLSKNAAENQQGVAVFSLEMSSVQLVTRLIAMEAGIPSGTLRNGQLSEAEFQQLNMAVEKLSQIPIFIDDTPGINIFDLRAKCRRLKNDKDIQMIVIDYLQLMTGAPGDKNGNREQEISMISRSLKGIAKELDVPVIALSQLSRAVETRGGEKRPMLSDLRESGAIEQDADIVVFIYRPGYYGIEESDLDVPQDLTEIILAKHRNGGLGTVNLRFVAQYVKFEDPGDEGFTNDLTTDDFNPNPFSSITTRPSKLNEGNMDDDLTMDEESPF